MNTTMENIALSRLIALIINPDADWREYIALSVVVQQIAAETARAAGVSFEEYIEGAKDILAPEMTRDSLDRAADELRKHLPYLT